MDLTPYIPQLITAVAALGGVVLTLIFGGRRDKRHLALEQAKFDREINKAVEIRFESVKREAFTRHLTNANRLNGMLRSRDGLSLLEKALGRDPYIHEIEKLVRDYASSGEEILLLAPELTEQIGRVGNLMIGCAQSHSLSRRYSSETETRTYAEIATLRRLMQTNLAIQLPAAGPRTQKQATETNPSGRPETNHP